MFCKLVPRPLTPTTGDMKALDVEVEQKLEKNVLKLDDWSEQDPYAGVGGIKRFFKKLLPQSMSIGYSNQIINHQLNVSVSAIHPQSNHRTFFLGVQGGPSGRGQPFVDIEIRVALLYKKLIQC